MVDFLETFASFRFKGTLFFSILTALYALSSLFFLIANWLLFKYLGMQNYDALFLGEAIILLTTWLWLFFLWYIFATIIKEFNPDIKDRINIRRVSEEQKKYEKRQQKISSKSSNQ